ncbi:hypothetical protein LTR94_030902, partial [Friedmanniomyces endolithicus]
MARQDHFLPSSQIWYATEDAKPLNRTVATTQQSAIRAIVAKAIDEDVDDRRSAPNVGAA